MLGPLALVAVGQQQREARPLTPLRPPSGEELVDHDLGHVDEVAELGLPQYQVALGRDGDAVFEPDDGGLRERRVVDLEARVRDLCKRRVSRSGRRVVEHEVPVAEGAALTVLARETHGDAVPQERPDGKCLGVCPVEREVGTEVLPAAGKLPHELRVDREPLRDFEKPRVDPLQLVERHLRVGIEVLHHRPEVRMGPGEHDFLVQGLPAEVLSLAQFVGQRLRTLPDLVAVDQPPVDERLGPASARCGVVRDRGVQRRLRVARLVGLIVAVAPVSHEIDHGVVVESPAVRHGQPDGGEALLGRVPVGVNDRDVVALGQVAGVSGGTAVVRVGGEANLVVGDDVDAAPHLVAAQARQVQGLGNDALGGEGRVSVDEHGHDA